MLLIAKKKMDSNKISVFNVYTAKKIDNNNIDVIRSFENLKLKHSNEKINRIIRLTQGGYLQSHQITCTHRGFNTYKKHAEFSKHDTLDTRRLNTQD